MTFPNTYKQAKTLIFSGVGPPIKVNVPTSDKTHPKPAQPKNPINLSNMEKLQIKE
jgi:hypothetical protein